MSTTEPLSTPPERQPLACVVGPDRGPENEGEAFERLSRRVALNMPLTLDEAAEFTTYPRDTLRKMVAEGRIKRAVLDKGTGRRRRHYVLLPKELMDELREQQRRR